MVPGAAFRYFGANRPDYSKSGKGRTVFHWRSPRLGSSREKFGGNLDSSNVRLKILCSRQQLRHGCSHIRFLGCPQLLAGPEQALLFVWSICEFRMVL